MELGEELYWFEEKKQYKEIGHETFNAYLADPDVDISRIAAFKLKGIFQTYISELKVYPDILLQAGWTKLDVIRPFVNKDNVNEWISNAVTLSRGDLKIKIKEDFPPPEPPPLPDGVYRVIYADPPWKYNDELIEGYGAATHHYQTLSIDELCEYSVDDRYIKDLAGDNAVLFMWVVEPMLEDAFKVINAWGFKYKALIVWDKVKHNYGHYVSVRSELLLICTKGSCVPDDKTLFDNVVTIERSSRHSEKPEEFRKIIDTLYPIGPRVELFGRRKAKGWEVWGNEL